MKDITKNMKHNSENTNRPEPSLSQNESTQKMTWDTLLTSKRLGLETEHKAKDENRSQFQRDYDRLLFSAPFRRLQNKTQVFPLPGSIFVHNRLTHSLEVSTVGRSLAQAILLQKEKNGTALSPLLSEIGAIVSAACLAHDMGNPPFGHSGEKAINTYFSEGEGDRFQALMSEKEWADITSFEGNANVFRLLTHQFAGRREGGFTMTYSMLASVVKYPYESIYCNEGEEKFGFFQSEIVTFEKIAKSLGLIKNPNQPKRYARHPLVYLVEAADDICYQIMDIEDAFKLHILTKEETMRLLSGFIPQDKDKKASIYHKFVGVDDDNEQIAYLRSIAVGQLVKACSDVFMAHEDAILRGTFEGTLISNLPPYLSQAYTSCSETAYAKIYNSHEVVDVELAGYRIIRQLLHELTSAVMHPEKAYASKLLARIPKQYEINAPSTYGKIQAILDFISGMTDIYALDLYRKISGMNLPTL